VFELPPMKYCQVTSYMSKGPVVISNNHMCAERQLIRRLYRECRKKGYKPHQFTEWLHRKHGEMVIERKTVYGDAISLPCVLCRKAMERLNIPSPLLFVFEIMGIKLFIAGDVFNSFGFSISIVLFFLNSSIVRSPPNSLRLNLYGAGFMDPIWLYIFFRIITMFPQMRPPRLRPYFSNA